MATNDTSKRARLVFKAGLFIIPLSLFAAPLSLTLMPSLALAAPSGYDFDFDGAYSASFGHADWGADDPIPGSGDVFFDLEAHTACLRFRFDEAADYDAATLALTSPYSAYEWWHMGALLGAGFDGDALTRWVVYSYDLPTGPNGEFDPVLDFYDCGNWHATVSTVGSSVGWEPGGGGGGEWGYGVAYHFVAEDGLTELPQAVMDLLPVDSSTYPVGTEITAPAPSTNRVEVDGGAWVWRGWQDDSLVMVSPGLDFVGVWSFEPDPSGPVDPPVIVPDPVYDCDFVFVSADGSALPDEVLALCPGGMTGLHDGDTVGTGPGFPDVEVDGGFWRFVSWDYDSQTVDGADLLFTGTWEFHAAVPMVPVGPSTPTVPMVPLGPAAPVGPDAPASTGSGTSGLPQMGDGGAVAALAATAGSALSAVGVRVLRKKGGR